MKIFLAFALISGVGWLLDIISFTLLSENIGIAPSCANFFSSMFGVTYVWFIALKKIFKHREYGRSRYLPVYWGYQAVSILSYSAFISFVAASGYNRIFSEILGVSFNVVAKLIITPANLLTNYLFMKILIKFMR